MWLQDRRLRRPASQWGDDRPDRDAGGGRGARVGRRAREQHPPPARPLDEVGPARTTSRPGTAPRSNGSTAAAAASRPRRRWPSWTWTSPAGTRCSARARRRPRCCATRSATTARCSRPATRATTSCSPPTPGVRAALRADRRASPGRHRGALRADLPRRHRRRPDGVRRSGRGGAGATARGPGFVVLLRQHYYLFRRPDRAGARRGRRRRPPRRRRPLPRRRRAGHRLLVGDVRLRGDRQAGAALRATTSRTTATRCAGSPSTSRPRRRAPVLVEEAAVVEALRDLPATAAAQHADRLAQVPSSGGARSTTAARPTGSSTLLARPAGRFRSGRPGDQAGSSVWRSACRCPVPAMSGHTPGLTFAHYFGPRNVLFVGGGDEPPSISSADVTRVRPFLNPRAGRCGLF